MFRARLPSIFNTCHKMPRLPRIAPCRHLTQPSQCHLQKNNQHDTSKVLCLPRKLPQIVWKRRKSIAPATQNDFQHIAKHVWMTRSATPATRNEATKRWKPPNLTTSAELPIGTAILGSYERLRTVANGCGHKRNVDRTHPQPPDPQSETGTLATHSGKCAI